MIEEIMCVECGSINTVPVSHGVNKCLSCYAYFSTEELPTKIEKIKPKIKIEDEDDDQS